MPSLPSEHPIPELLAPAGGPVAARAAIANGADAIYLGLGTLNARRGVENFDLASLADATRFAHLRGAKAYLTANVLVLPDEMEAAVRMIDEAWAVGIDAVIVQDIGLMGIVAQLLPSVRLHASTQANAHNASTVAALADIGASRVTLARELSLQEIAALVSVSSVEMESFVHGSLCYSYSGQCLMSSVVSGRSANRGLCAQPCRAAYELYRREASQRTPGRHLLSPKDLAGIGHLPQLVETGVSALKIEGRAKSPEYVAAVTRVYRAALDRLAADPESFRVTEGEQSVLEEAFSRGFTSAYLSGERDRSAMSYSRPNDRGVLVGRIESISGKAASVRLDRALDASDTVEVWTSRGRSSQVVGGLRVGASEVTHAPAGSVVSMRMSGDAKAGDRVFRVENAALADAARRSYSGLPDDVAPLPASISVTARVGEPLLVSVTATGREGRASGALIERARTKAITAGEIMEHVGRLGGTSLRAASWEIELDPDVGVGYSELHAVRRDAVRKLYESLLEPWSRRVRVSPLVEPPLSERATRPVERVELVAVARYPRQIAACAEGGADRVLLDLSFAGQGSLPSGAEPMLPRVVHEAEVQRFLEAAADAGRATTANLGLVRELAARSVPADADWPLNSTNPWAVAAIAEMGAGMVWASPELSERQLANVCAHASFPIGAVVHGRIEVMVAEICAIQAAVECDRQCAACGHRGDAWYLEDKKGYRFPVTSDSMGRAHVYNSVPLALGEVLDEVLGTGVAAVRVDLLDENAKAAEAVVSWYRDAIDARVGGARRPGIPPWGNHTKGHFFRPVR